jgi:serine/threonine protein kinase/Tol biopolymer transport system component
MGMNSKRLRRIEELYHLAGERPPDERETFLAEACADDSELLRHVLALLAHDSGSGAMARPVLEMAAELLADSPAAQWTAGTQVGPYQIVSRLGEGGMGEVFKARDTRLGREVAIKRAHQEFNARFQREARAISSLNHHNICTLYDVGPNYLVMELLEGPTLASQLQRGRLPMTSMLQYGEQIADALAAAHAKGVIHRDLKPGNIVVTKAGVKVLDFGLAKFAPSSDSVERSIDTVTASNAILGTPAYMAPEQLEGKECDSRTDIFALGLLLYEMATGKRPFHGDSQAALTADIMRCEPPLAELSPPHFAHVVERCLAKDPEDRWQNAREVKLELEFVGRSLSIQPAPPERKRRLWPALLGITGVLAALITLAIYFKSGPIDLMAVPLTSYPGLAMQPSLSPDGNQIAFTWNGEREGVFHVYVKQIGPGNALQLTSGPADEVMCRWSPDGKWIAFLRRQREKGAGTAAGVYVIPPLGGLEKKLGDAELNSNVDNRLLGGTVDCLDWSGDGKWVVVSRRPSPSQPAGLALLSLDGGEPRQITSPADPQFDHYAAFAPGGRAIAFLRRRNALTGSLMLLPLSPSMQPAGSAVKIAPGLDPSIRTFAWTADGRDLIASAGYPESAALWRVRASVGAAPRLLPFQGSEPAISRSGNRLVFSRHSFEWNIWSLDLDQTGRAIGSAVRAFDSSKNELTPSFSPDGSKVAFGSNRSGFYEIWVCRTNGSDCGQLTAMRTYAGSPEWSPDGKWIAFDDVTHIYVISSAGGKPRMLADGLAPRWSHDGGRIYFQNIGGIGRISPSGGAPQPVTEGRFAAESPDGNWVYYTRAQSLWRVPSSGGESKQVLTAVFDRNFIILDAGIWYLKSDGKEARLLQYFDLKSKIDRTVYRTARRLFVGLAIAPDRRRVLFTQVDREPSRDLMLVENFR